MHKRMLQRWRAALEWDTYSPSDLSMYGNAKLAVHLTNKQATSDEQKQHRTHDSRCQYYSCPKPMTQDACICSSGSSCGAVVAVRDMSLRI